jgi:hypothetical protein
MGVPTGGEHTLKQKFFTGKTERRPNYLDRILEHAEGENTSDTEEDSHSDKERDAREDDREARRRLSTYQIPKLHKGKRWNKEQLENLRKNWPHLKNFDDSVLQDATLTELTAMGKQKVSGSRLLSQTLSANFEQLQHFPTKVGKGEDDCLGLVHPARFLRGYVGDTQELWKQARDD